MVKYPWQEEEKNIEKGVMKSSMSNTTNRYESPIVFTSHLTRASRLMYLRVIRLVHVVKCIHESYDPCPSLGRLTVFHLTTLSPDGGASIKWDFH